MNCDTPRGHSNNDFYASRREISGYEDYPELDEKRDQFNNGRIVDADVKHATTKKLGQRILDKDVTARLGKIDILKIVAKSQ